MNSTQSIQIPASPSQAIALTIALAFPLAHTTVQAQISATWVNAVSENQTFKVLEPTEVRYGAGTSWVQRTVNGSIKCSNNFFGRDPASGAVKSCQILSKFAANSAPATTGSSAMWVKASNENQTFKVNGSTEVRYGAGANWIQRTASGTVSCNNGFFGSDPARATAKTCEVANTPTDSAVTPSQTASWTKVADENRTFNVKDPTEVRYGAGSKWIQRTVTGAITCNNGFFGSDPARNVAKSCEISNAPVIGATPAPAPGSTPSTATANWMKAASESQTFSLNGPTVVRFGTGTKWVERTLNGTITCTNSFFGTDPAQGSVKTCQVPDGTAIGSAPSANPAPTPSPTSQGQPLVAANAFSCAAGAITCVEVASSGGDTQASVPVTFGVPFKSGVWQHKSSGLVARDNQQQAVPLQVDDISSHRDGSARFAVLNARLSNLQAGERRIISFFPGSTSALTSLLPADPAWNLQLQAKIFSPQVTKITLGNRDGIKAGIPFLKDETITLKFSGISNESFTVRVSDTTGGGGHSTLTKLAEEFMTAINTKSSVYLVEKPVGTHENFYVKSRNPGQGSFKADFTYSGAAQISQIDISGFKTPQIWEINGQNLLKAAIAKANAQQTDTNRRFHGPVATEFHLTAPFKHTASGDEHNFLTARLDTRLYENGTRIRTDVVIENNWAFKANPRNIVYELTIKQNGKVVEEQPAFEHYHHARWHKVVWTQSPKIVLRHNMRDFLDSGAVPNYDLSLSIPEAVLNKDASNLAAKRAAQKHLGPMGNVFLTPAFGSAGGRPEIGPLPRWTAAYLVSQDQRAYESMMAVADAAGAVPIHYRDETTDHPVNTIQYPDFSTYLTSASKLDPTIFAPDTAHQASFTYVPYLVTGDRFYRDEAMFWASWNVFSMPASYRGNAMSLVNRHEIRGQAWGLRSIGEAYRILPDTHSMKPYFTQILQNNINFYLDYYVTKGLGSPLGSMQHSNGISTPPWQDDFMAVIFAQLAENKDPNASAVHAWFSKFTVGRFLAEGDGFCTARAPGYYWKFAAADGTPYTSWADMFSANYPADVGKPCSTLAINEGYPTIAGGYAAYARGMLGASANVNFPNAGAAYSRWKSMTPQMDKDFNNDPTWAIVPR